MVPLSVDIMATLERSQKSGSAEINEWEHPSKHRAE